MHNHIFAICVSNEDYEVSLERRKLYEVIEDKEIEQIDCLKVIDESGEPYIYPKDFFAIITLSEMLEQQIMHAA